MTVYVSSQSIHSDPEIWGSDVLEFKPSRWINASGDLITPSKGTFLPWSAGPRMCPGMKMAQVEFVAAFATMFRSSKCHPLRCVQETEEELRKRLEYLMADSIPRLTLQIRDPKEVKLKWIRDR
jgi:cytochrome P450